MICSHCKEEISPGEKMITLYDGTAFHRVPCSPKAERSEVLQGCPPSATGSADARASDESGADSSGRSADPRSDAFLDDLESAYRILDEAVGYFIRGKISSGKNMLGDGMLRLKEIMAKYPRQSAKKAAALPAQRERAGLPNSY